MPAESSERDRLRVALYSGLLIRHDAISGSLAGKLDLLDRWRDQGLPVEAVAFVQSTDRARSGVVVAPTASSVLTHPAFASADVHLFEFGIHYALFDLAFVTPHSARRLAVYHNITPLELVEEPVARGAVERSVRQKANLDVMDHVICDSEFNRDDLVAYGLRAERLSVLHLPAPDVVSPRSTRPARSPRPRVELLFVGRFVRAKGVVDLLRAVELLLERGVMGFRVTLAGNQTLSDPAVVAAVRRAVADPAGTVRFVGEPDDRRLAELMARSDVVVIPSYHEGYCVPVVEAYTLGCQVTTYDAGNLPNVVGDLGLIVPTGDIEGLADALAEQIGALQPVDRPGRPREVPTAAGPRSVADWQEAVAAHLTAYSAEAYESGLRNVLADQARLVRGLSPTVVDALAGARGEVR
jgi:glycosyltransferase involved in cell wall biosynthesis